MSPQTMAMTTYEEVYMDPVLEEELFGGYDAAVEELFGSYEGLKAAVSSSKSSAPSPSKSPSLDLEDKQLLDKHIQQCFGENAVTGTTRPSQLVKSSTQLNMEEQKREKARRREQAMKAPESAMDALNRGAAPNEGPSGSAKRKRGRDEEGESPEAKKVLVNATLTSAPTLNAPQKRKRSGENEDEGRVAKRGLMDDAAAEIEQRRDHSFSKDSDTDCEGSDSVIGAGDAAEATFTPEKTQKVDNNEEQHLAPLSTATTVSKVTANLTITDEDDEMTCMLKEELAKTLDDDDDEPEDPRIEEIFEKAGLTFGERRKIAVMLDNNFKEGKGPTTLEKVQKAADMMIAAHAGVAKKKTAAAAKGPHAPKKPSRLGKEVRAEGQEIKARPKLASKAKKPAPGIAHGGGVVAAAPSVVLKPPMQSSSLANPAPARATAATPAPTAASIPSSKVNNTTYDTFTLNDMKELCGERGLVKSGNKAGILQRLKDYDGDVAAGRPPKGVKKAKKEEKRVPLSKKLKEGYFKSSG